jgi:hypothetical protein
VRGIDMVDIDRRTMIGAAGVAGVAGLAGAGVALTTCSEKKHMIAEPVGYCDLAGQSVLHLKPEINGGVSECIPSYICVVYIKFESDLKLKVRRTYIGKLTSKPVPPFVASMVTNALDSLARTGKYNSFDESDIDPINLGSQQILVIYIDNRTDRIRFKYDPNDINAPDKNLSFDNTIRFVKFSSKGPTLLIRDNHAFFNIMKMDIVQAGTLLESNVAFRLDYWNTDEMGKDIGKLDPMKPSTHFLYSMNIHLEILAPMANGAEKWVPIILDPDTGNGGGDP